MFRFVNCFAQRRRDAIHMRLRTLIIIMVYKIAFIIKGSHKYIILLSLRLCDFA
jgi:hypothetical protein